MQYLLIVSLLIVGAIAVGFVIFGLYHEHEQRKLAAKYEELLAYSNGLAKYLKQLEKYKGILDAEKHAKDLRDAGARAAEGLLAQARGKSQQILAEAQSVRESILKSEAEWNAKALEREQSASQRAGEIKAEIATLELASAAIKRAIDGVGHQYLIPTNTFLDELAQGYSHKQAGQRLKQARARTTQLVKDSQAALCDYIERERKETAERFVTDAFNGKVDSILARARHDNAGTLQQEIRDAYAVVNLHGRAFRNARITHKYLEARIDELNWAVATHELRRQEVEEQRRVRQQIRDEEKAQRDYARQIKLADKQERDIQSRIAEFQRQADAASAEQRLAYEQRVADLKTQLAEAEARNQRAKSMAQQTRTGHVYVLSNLGAFGENIYKVGMTRRLDPMDRIWELSDASVPFDFDVHAIIQTDDAPDLELKIHNALLIKQVNKINRRKEYYRVAISDIRGVFESLGVQAAWTLLAEAREYHETLALERQMAENPQVRQAWLTRQLDTSVLSSEIRRFSSEAVDDPEPTDNPDTEEQLASHSTR
ncbi:MAG: DUF4041 domain-containing protein [Planctomyces sp.]|nr:DUF4041 domain-containing protein [Planctomyces sp.]